MTKFAFNSVPTITAKRSSFRMNHTVSTSMPIGKLVPIEAVEVYPGDTFTMDTTVVSRLTSSFIKPIYGNLNLDVFYFYVPSRICYNKWGEIFGENNSSPYALTTPVNAPTISKDVASDCYSCTVADYLGVPPGFSTDMDNNINLSAIPFRAFALIWNDWFRDENTQYPVNVQKGETGQYEYLNDNEWNVNNYCGQLPPVNKYHDYFTSALPSPQKGNAVSPLGTVPIITAEDVHYMGDSDYSTNNSLRLGRFNINTGGFYFPNASEQQYLTFDISREDGSLAFSYDPSSISSMYSADIIDSSNLVADMSSINVNDLRNAFALQRMLEMLNVGGSRYTEYISTFFGVTSPDSRLQRPEYLGGHRVPINVQQVATTSTDNLAELGAYSLSNGKGHFSKGFVEHGWLFTVACIRQEHIYSQGLSKSMTRIKQGDFYNPVLAHLGEQPIYQYEIYLKSSGQVPSTTPLNIFGYQEAWADLRYLPSRVSGCVRPNLYYAFEDGTVVNNKPIVNPSSLAVYNIADNYDNAPTLSGEFISEQSYLDGRIAVDEDSMHPFVIDVGFTGRAIRNMPTRSVPKLVG